MQADLDPILDRAEKAALALDGDELNGSVEALRRFEPSLAMLKAGDPVLLHVERRLQRLRGLCGGLNDALGEALGIEEKYGAHGEKLGGPTRLTNRGYA
ncbi:MAG: hypothetical protein AAFU77_06130 [Myxococcota bacterium]